MKTHFGKCIKLMKPKVNNNKNNKNSNNDNNFLAGMVIFINRFLENIAFFSQDKISSGLFIPLIAFNSLYLLQSIYIIQFSAFIVFGIYFMNQNPFTLVIFIALHSLIYSLIYSSLIAFIH